MTSCNFITLMAHPIGDELKDVIKICRITAQHCAGESCILQRILAAPPMNSPIVAQAFHVETGSGPMPDNVSITIQPTVSMGPEPEGSKTYTVAEVASKLRLTSAGVTYRANKLKVGTKVGCHLMFSEDDLIKLTRKRKGQHDIGKHPKEPKPGKGGHIVETAITEEANLSMAGEIGCEHIHEEPIRKMESVIQTEPAPSETEAPDNTPYSPEHRATVLGYYRSCSYIKITPETVAAKLQLPVKMVMRICEVLNEAGLLCFAGTSGYYSRGK